MEEIRWKGSEGEEEEKRKMGRGRNRNQAEIKEKGGWLSAGAGH